jgi:hypothetical protein
MRGVVGRAGRRIRHGRGGGDDDDDDDDDDSPPL